MGATAPAERRRLASAAHDAVRGIPKTEEQLLRAASARERAGWNQRTSANEKVLDAWLRAQGVFPIREKAVGIYNVDFAIETVAVEVLGGSWHACKPAHARRTPYILNQGWALLFVWSFKRAPLCAEAGEYLISYLEETRRNPSLRGQYRVIRGDGQVAASGGSDDDEFALVPPSVCGFSGRPLN
jgi:very-short-patch-repair endonuclease